MGGAGSRGAGSGCGQWRPWIEVRFGASAGAFADPESCRKPRPAASNPAPYHSNFGTGHPALQMDEPERRWRGRRGKSPRALWDDSRCSRLGHPQEPANDRPPSHRPDDSPEDRVCRSGRGTTTRARCEDGAERDVRDFAPDGVRGGCDGRSGAADPLSARTLFDGAVITVFDERRSPTGTMGAGCRMSVTESSRYAAPALRFGPSGDPPPTTRRSAAMAVSELTATGRSPDALCAGMRCAWSRHWSARCEPPVPVPVPSNS